MWWKKVTFPNLFIIAGLLNLLTTILIIVLKRFLPPVVPIFYGKPTGINQLASTFSLLIAPGTSLLLSVTNIFVSSISKDDFIKKFLAIASFVISIMAIITVVKIIFLVGFF